MYELTVRRKFSAAHQLRGYKGKCEALHGHTYAIEVYLRAGELDNIGLAVDFKELKKIIDGVLERYDHSFINEVPPFDEENPSAENMARVVYGEIKKSLPENVSLSRVMVWESEDAGASYFEE
jgi:6-pyruvoyltetrahydropterin/6-carboxytetrahydropterin synthase